MNNNYIQELNKLIFTFNDDEILDYQVLISLYGEIYTAGLWESNNEEILESLFHLLKTFKQDLNIPVQIDLENFVNWTVADYKTCLIFIYQTLITNNNILSSEFYNSFFITILQKIEETVFPIDQNDNYLNTCILKMGTNIMNPKYLREYLIRKNIKNYHCDRCGLSEWQNEPLLLLLNFINGDITNQQLDNLQFLCPNCASQIGRETIF